MLGLEEGRQQAVCLQQALPSEPHAAIGHLKEPLGFVIVPDVLPLGEDIDAKLVLEVGGFHVTTFEQKNEFPHEQLVRRGPHGPLQRQLAALQCLEVVRPLRMILIVDARHMAEACHAGRQQIASMPQIIAVAEVGLFRMLDHRVGAGDAVADLLQFGKRIVYPCPLRRPIGHGRLDFIAENVLRVDRVKGQFHLIDRDALGRKLDRTADVFAPVIPCLADHAGDQIDVDVGKIRRLDPLPRFVNLSRLVGATVLFQNLVVKVFHAQADSRDADFFERADLRLRERARLALEGDLLGLVPIDALAKSIDQRGELLGAQKRRGAPAEIDEAKRTIAHHRQPAD